MIKSIYAIRLWLYFNIVITIKRFYFTKLFFKTNFPRYLTIILFFIFCSRQFVNAQTKESTYPILSHLMDCYRSGKTSLCTDSMNYYDVRILGTWCSIDLKRMCVITRPRNTYFYLVLYRWDELEKKYVIHTNRVAPNAANIDSTLFLELDFGINPNGERFPTNYIPIKYTFFNNDEMEICGISQTYFQKNIDVKTRSLTSNNTYRESVKENINNYGFFTDVNHFYRFKGEFPHDKRNDEMQVSSSSNDDAKAVLGLALLLFATTALFSDQSVTSPYPSQDIHKGETLGYDKDGEAIPSGGLRSTWDIKYDKDYKPKF